jgi:ADP-ribose pyrophosphatase YjhB (NUDIX family)/quercetin dioxygenase-like cupin family protein
MNKPNFIKIDGQELDNILAKDSRQYLVGNLKLPQELQHIHSKNIEIGISSYDKYEIEEGHYHTKQVEYQYILSGKTEYKNIDTNEVFSFQKGDFYCIETGTKYAQRIYNNSKILFIKLPAINDKQLLPTTEKLKKWFDEHLNNTIRRQDYFYSDNAPQPNSIVPAAAIIENDKLLLIRRVDNDMWSLPGGTLEFGESLEDCIVREVKEETGLDIKIDSIQNIYSNPNILIEYANGEVRQEFTTVYNATKIGGELKIDNESKDIKWVPLKDVMKLNMAESQEIRIQDIVNGKHG